MLNASTPLKRETERVIETVIGCAVNVHRTLGPGFFEPVYHNALRIEFVACGVPSKARSVSSSNTEAYRWALNAWISLLRARSSLK
jgi:hypothetical protein